MTGDALRVLWTHNFDPHFLNAGVFMFQAADAVRAHGVHVELMYVGNLREPAGIARALPRIRRAANAFDLVHSQFGSACGLATSAVRNRPIVVSLRGSDWQPAAANSRVWRAHGRTAATMTRLSLPRFDLVVSVSQRIEREVRRSYPRVPTVVLPDPIDLDKFKPMDKAEARRHLGLDQHKTYVLFTAVHSGSPNKRRELAQAALDVARSEYPDIEMLVATGLPHDDMPVVVAAADAAMCTSVAEGWPNSMKEALACNVPFVATDVSDLRDIARREPSCQVTDATPEALGGALVDVLRRHEKSDLRRHLSGMTMDAFATGLVAAYNGVITKATKGA